MGLTPQSLSPQGGHYTTRPDKKPGGTQWTQPPPARNYAIEIPAFGEFAGINTTRVQWLISSARWGTNVCVWGAAPLWSLWKNTQQGWTNRTISSPILLDEAKESSITVLMGSTPRKPPLRWGGIVPPADASTLEGTNPPGDSSLQEEKHCRKGC